jgi:hypothetical protein
MNTRPSSVLTLYLLLLFPGFFMFHVAHSLGYVPYFGWFGGLLVLGIAFLYGRGVYRVVVNGQRISTVHASISIPVQMFFFYVLAVTAVMHVFSGYDYVNMEGLVWNLTNLILLLGFYLLGRNLNVKMGGLLTVLLLCAYLGYMYFTFQFYSSLNGTIILPVETESAADSTASYQSMAMCVLYTAIALCPFVRSRFLKSTLLLMSVAILYFIGSRTEFFLLCLVAPVFIYINFGMRGAIGLALLALPVVIYLAATLEVNERFAGIFEELGSGSSRTELMLAGMKGIFDNPIFGDYLGQVREHGNVGAYIHNGLSVYQQFGLVGFLLYMYLIVCSLIIGLLYLSQAKQYPQLEALVYASIISLVGVLISKSIGWPLPALAWGLACSVMLTMRAAKQSQAANETTPEPVAGVHYSA